MKHAMKESIWLTAGFVVATIGTVAILSLAYWLARPCKPGDPGIMIGSAMLVAGCPDAARGYYRGSYQ